MIIEPGDTMPGRGTDLRRGVLDDALTSTWTAVLPVALCWQPFVSFGVKRMTSATASSAETESDLILRAQVAVSRCNWEVGECAAIWTKRFSRGRTDGDFAELVGLSADQVYQRRRVWETFGDVCGNYGVLKWSHFYAAITWDDAAECLQWAQDIGATVAEMRAWRRAQRGEDLSTDADEESLGWLPTEPSEVRVPAMSTMESSGHGESDFRSPAAPVAAGVARESGSGDDYAPFRPDAMTPPREAPAAARPAPSTEQIVRRLTSMLEKAVATITDDFANEFASVSDKDRRRFLKAVATLAEKVDDLR